MGFFSRLKQGLERTRINLAGLFSGAVIDEDFFEELETSLIAADIGVESTNLILERLRDTVKPRKRCALRCAMKLSASSYPRKSRLT